MSNEFSFIRIYTDLANQKVDRVDLLTLYNDLKFRTSSDPSLHKHFLDNEPDHITQAIGVDAVAHAIHNKGDTVLQEIYPGADYEILKKSLDELAGKEADNPIRQTNRGYFTTIKSEDGVVFLEKQQIGRTTLEDVSDALEEYKKFLQVGIASPAEILTLHRSDPGNEEYALIVREKKLDNYDNEPIVVGGPASLEMVDKQGHLITAAALKDAFQKFMQNFRSRNAMIIHSDVQCGWIIPAYISRNGAIFRSGVDDNGLWVITELRDDTKIAKKVAEDVKEGKLKSYSIAGSALKTQNIQKGANSFMQVDQMELQEITLCLVPETHIFTHDGRYPEIKDVKINDYVLTHNARFMPVTEIFKREIDEEILRIELDFGAILEITKEHPVYTLDPREGTYIWKPASQLTTKSILCWAKRPKQQYQAKIISITPFHYKGIVYNLAVESDLSYVANNLIVHNCEKGVNPAAHFDILKSESLVNNSTISKIDIMKSLSEDPIEIPVYLVGIDKSNNKPEIVICADRKNSITDTIRHFIKKSIGNSNIDITVKKQSNVGPFIPLYRLYAVPVWVDMAEDEQQETTTMLIQKEQTTNLLPEGTERDVSTDISKSTSSGKGTKKQMKKNSKKDAFSNWIEEQEEKHWESMDQLRRSLNAEYGIPTDEDVEVTNRPDTESVTVTTDFPWTVNDASVEAEYGQTALDIKRLLRELGVDEEHDIEDMVRDTEG